MSLSRHLAYTFTISQKEKFETARFELHQLLSQPSLHGVPLLVVSPYCDTAPELH